MSTEEFLGCVDGEEDEVMGAKAGAGPQSSPLKTSVKDSNNQKMQNDENFFMPKTTLVSSGEDESLKIRIFEKQISEANLLSLKYLEERDLLREEKDDLMDQIKFQETMFETLSGS